MYALATEHHSDIVQHRVVLGEVPVLCNTKRIHRGGGGGVGGGSTTTTTEYPRNNWVGTSKKRKGRDLEEEEEEAMDEGERMGQGMEQGVGKGVQKGVEEEEEDDGDNEDDVDPPVFLVSTTQQVGVLTQAGHVLMLHADRDRLIGTSVYHGVDQQGKGNEEGKKKDSAPPPPPPSVLCSSSLFHVVYST
jgi:hypothetical protein